MDVATSNIGQQQFENLVSNLPGIVYRCENDPNWTMRFISGKITEMTGYPPSDFINNKIRSFASIMHPDDANAVDETVQECIREKLPFNLEYRIIKKNNEIAWVLERGQGVYDENGALLWLDGIILDYTEHKNLEQLKQEVERMMRHDLRTPLNNLISIPQIMKQSWELSDEQFEFIDLIESSAKKMLNMLNLSLDLYKMEMGNYEFKPERIDIISILKVAIADLKRLLKTAEVSVEIRFNGEELNESDIMILDVEQLLCYSIFINLLSNAIEASNPKDVVFINLDDADGQPKINFTNSQPVPEAIRNSFFEKYVTYGKSDGTGLGTYIAKLMVEIQNGIIHLTSSKSEGTCITLTFLDRP